MGHAFVDDSVVGDAVPRARFPVGGQVGKHPSQAPCHGQPNTKQMVVASGIHAHHLPDLPIPGNCWPLLKRLQLKCARSRANDSDIASLTQRLLQKDPRERPTAQATSQVP